MWVLGQGEVLFHHAEDKEGGNHWCPRIRNGVSSARGSSVQPH